jgi:prepilin-type N-terminal cleavage/methylation domain-containing protein
MKRGFTLVEILICLAIVGMLGMIAVPNLLQALEIKQSSSPVINVLLRNASNLSQAITGLNGSNVTVSYKKATGAYANLSTPTMTEISSTAMPGLYNLSLNSSVTDTVGQVVIYTSATGAETYRGLYDVVANLEADTYTALGNGTVVAGNLTTMSTTAAAMPWSSATRTLSSGAITTGSFASGAINAAAIADDAIDAGAIAADAIGASEIATDAITPAEIQDGAITAVKIATGALTSAKFATGAINSTGFAQSAADLVWGTTTRNITGGNLSNPQAFNNTGTTNLNGTLSY